MEWWQQMDPQRKRMLEIVLALGLAALAGVFIYLRFNGSSSADSSASQAATDASQIGVLQGVTEILPGQPGPAGPAGPAGPPGHPGAYHGPPGKKLIKPVKPAPKQPAKKPTAKKPTAKKPGIKEPAPGHRPAPKKPTAKKPTKPTKKLPPRRNPTANPAAGPWYFGGIGGTGAAMPSAAGAPPVMAPPPPPGAAPMNRAGIDSAVVTSSSGPASTLQGIADMIYGEATGEQVAGLEKANNLTSGEELYPGQVIVIPGASAGEE